MFSRLKRIFTEYKELRHLAYHDSLTGLLNRNWLYKNMPQIKTKYVYFIDINDLHTVNEKGHSFGDMYIQKAIATISHNGVLLRYAGDEFLLFTDDLNACIPLTFFTYGVARIQGDCVEAIQKADTQMLLKKKKRKMLK